MSATLTPAVRNGASGSQAQDRQTKDPAATLKRVFGFDSFREGQREVMTRLLDGRSVLSVFPTGAGKSLCYQLPALLLDGLTLVISPLIALMKDQIDFLTERGVPAARLDSSLDRAETLQVYDNLRSGRLKLLYVSPERLGNERFEQLLSRLRISLLAIDEAHCISEWGHNFRPDYLRIAQLARQLKVQRVLALTATATPAVADDIAAAFDIESDDVVHTGFYRPNLTLRVTPCASNRRNELLFSRISQRPAGPAIVYVTLQRTAEKVAGYLQEQGLNAAAYHAGMNTDKRTDIQEAFMASDAMIVVATIAFGMGIDKANIRAVYHYNLPKSLESYAQEIGRAGRDGEPSICEMLASADDVTTLENFAYGDTPTEQAVTSLCDELLSQGDVFDVSVYDLSHRYDVRPLVVKTLLTYLELDGVIHSTGPFYSECKFQPRCASAKILARFDTDRADFLRRIFSHARKGKTWFSLDVEQVSRSLGEPRRRVVTALSYLEEQGDLVVQVAGVREGYRAVKLPDDRKSLSAALVQRFVRREEQDIARVRRVVQLANHDGCWTRSLLDYFGESRDDCGHCGRCLGDNQGGPIAAVRSAASKNQGPRDQDRDRVRQLRGEQPAALAEPRQMARLLCGISSPASGRAKLQKHPLFGTYRRVPFRKVMAWLEGID